MVYRMEIFSEESTIVSRQIETGEFIDIKIEVGCRYVCDPRKTTNKKDRKNKGREVEVLGFTDNFSPNGVIVRYLDNKRRGLISPGDLMPILR